MKNQRIFIQLLFSFVIFGLNAQNVGINSTGSAPAASAGLDVDFNNKGVLIPRLTAAERDAIVNPATALMIYNTSSNCFEFYNVVWQSMGCSLPAAVVAALDCGNSVLSGTITSNIPTTGVSVTIPYTGGNGGVFPSQNINSSGVTGLVANLSSGNVASGNGTLQVTISGTATSSGVAIFSLNLGGQNCSFSVNVCSQLGAFTSTAATNLCVTGFTANWTSSTNATSYLLDVSTDNTFSTFVSGYNGLNVGNVLTANITGLTTNTTYYYRVHSTNACNFIENSTTTSATTVLSGCNIAQVAAAYGTVTNVPGATTLTWINRNLGATVQAANVNDVSDLAAGCYFQFNRPQAITNDLCDGAMTVNPAWTITSIDESSAWTLANDPCRINLGGAWRVPTKVEWQNVSNIWNIVGNYNTAYSSVLKLHAAGYLQSSSGELMNRGTLISLHSSTDNSTTQNWGYSATTSSSSASNIGLKTTGKPVRCVF